MKSLLELLTRRSFVRLGSAAAAGAALSACTMPLQSRRKVAPGRQVMINLPGQELDAESEAFIRAHDIRAVVLFQYNLVDAVQTRDLTAALREVMGTGALIAVDQEGGSVFRTPFLPYAPSAMSLGAGGSENRAFAVGKAVGRGLHGLGINWDFAPSLDVNVNPLNPVIGDRSFSSNPEKVAALGLAWARGCQEGGVATCAKHFPGHGDTVVDSHLGLPVVDRTREELERVELLPFRQAVASGMPAIMTSHIVFPAYDPVRPATLSPLILKGLLREQWNYDGVVITDSMQMKAIADGWGRDDAAVLALKAGADMVLAQGNRDNQIRTVAAIERALQHGDLTPVGHTRSVARLDRLARRFPSERGTYTDADLATDAALMDSAWVSGLTTYRNPMPPPPGARVLLVMAADAAGGGAADRGLRSEELVGYLKGLYDLQVITFDPGDPAAAVPAVRQATAPGTQVIFATTGRHRAEDPLKALISAARPDLHLALWNPYLVLDIDAPALIAFGFRPEALRAVAHWLRGEVQAEGTLPIDLPA